MFNALKYTEELEKAGFSRSQAEVSIKLLVDVMNENFATKSDLNELRAANRSDLNEVRNELKAEIKDLRSEMKNEVFRLESSIKEMEYKLTIKLGSMMALAIGVTATLVKLIPSGH